MKVCLRANGQEEAANRGKGYLALKGMNMFWHRGRGAGMECKLGGGHARTHRGEEILIDVDICKCAGMLVIKTPTSVIVMLPS